MSIFYHTLNVFGFHIELYNRFLTFAEVFQFDNLNYLLKKIPTSLKIDKLFIKYLTSLRNKKSFFKIIK